MSAGAPTGNTNARKGTAWRDALDWALNNYKAKGIKKAQALRKIAEKCVESAIDGDVSARTEIANRLDGKPTEYRESFIHQTVEVVAVQATSDWLGETVPEAASAASEEPRTH